jgi:hypothetical protein
MLKNAGLFDCFWYLSPWLTKSSMKLGVCISLDRTMAVEACLDKICSVESHESLEKRAELTRRAKKGWTGSRIISRMGAVPR